MATLEEVMDGLASQIQTELDPFIPNLQSVGSLNANPTPTSIDVYPGDPFMERFTMGDMRYWLSVRARVNTADHPAGQAELLSLMDPEADTSLQKAIESDPTIGGLVSDLAVEEVSPFGTFTDPGNVDHRLLGAIWRVAILL